VHMRVVRFTDVDPDRMDQLLARVDEAEGPPEGVLAQSIQIMIDRDQRTAVVLQEFATADDMAASEAALEGMDPSDTPGKRESVDRCEVKMVRRATATA
jgi:hypothetical protein